MTAAVLSFFAGVLLLQYQASLPDPRWLLLLALPVCLALLCAALHWQAQARCRVRALITRAAVLLCVLGAGFLWAAACAHYRMAGVLAPELEGRDIELVGVVTSLPASTGRALRFEFEPESGREGARLPALIRLVWYRAAVRAEMPEEEAAALEERTRIRPGERWRFSVRLRRPHGNVNPHGFDYEAWLLEHGIGATGYVRASPRPERLGERGAFSDVVGRVRESVRDRFFSVLGETPAAGILAALAVGDQASISAEEWRLFAMTGVTHLMSISGLHVTLISGLLAWLANWLWRRLPRLCLRLPARKVAAIAGIVGAFGYTVFAGYAVPAQRTCYMVAAVALALWSARVVTPARVLSLALFAVIVADPWASLAPGFWLSFAAVALILYAAGAARDRPLRALRQWLRVQWAITIGLAPAVLLFFGQVSLIGPLANALAIPLVSIVITPLALLAALLPFEALLLLSSRLTELLLMFLEWCASLPLAVWQGPAPALWCVVAAGFGAAWLLAPRGLPWRAAGLVLFLPAFALPAPSPGPGEAWITTLDVGQGLAVLVRTRTHALLYDAGPAYGIESDSGERVIVPLLRSLGIQRLDAMIITHRDTDHLGGAQSVLGSLEVAQVVSSLAARHELHAYALTSMRCAAGQGWEWDGVKFDMLGPAVEDFGKVGKARNNNLSCVMKLATSGGAVLLTGDIERAAEAALLSRDAAALRAHVMLVPHHGSRTSSGPAFLDAVAPSHAVVAAGYRNRFGHPHAEIVRRYEGSGVRVSRTDLDGAVHISLGAMNYSVTGEREASPRYWRPGPRI